jgi:hypothetical protein
VGIDLSIVPQNWQREDGVGHASRLDGLLRLKASHAKIFQSGLKTGGVTMVGGAYDTITDVTSESS